MNHASLRIEASPNEVEELAIVFFEPPPDGIGDQISELDQPRGLRVDEKWHLANPSHFAPAVATRSKVSGELLQPRLPGRSIKNDQPALIVPITFVARNVVIEAATELLESEFYGVSRAHSCLINCHAKQHPIPFQSS